MSVRIYDSKAREWRTEERYKIVRFYQHGRKRTMSTGLTLDQARLGHPPGRACGGSAASTRRTMTARYKPRDLTQEQWNFRVDLHAEKSPGGAYGYGETLDEAEKNAKHFFRRDFGRQKVRARIVQRWDEWRWVDVTEPPAP